jgi:transposase
MRPQPFRARFIPRNEKILKTMQQSARDAEERLGKYDGETKIFVQDFFKNSHI